MNDVSFAQQCHLKADLNGGNQGPFQKNVWQRQKVNPGQEFLNGGNSAASGRTTELLFDKKDRQLNFTNLSKSQEQRGQCLIKCLQMMRNVIEAAQLISPDFAASCCQSIFDW